MSKPNHYNIDIRRPPGGLCCLGLIDIRRAKRSEAKRHKDI